MSQKGSRVTSPSKNPIGTYEHSYVTIDPSLSSFNNQASTYSTYSIPNKQVYTGTSVNTYKTSRFTTDEVSKLTGSRVQQGSVVKGNFIDYTIGASRIQYVPYEKKVVDYETRTIKQMVPKARKVVEYTERKVVQTVPREVVKQDYYAVQKITQYYKQIIPEKKVQIVPVEKKVKKIQYIPVEKQVIDQFRQIVHYPQNENWRNVQGQSRVLLESQGIAVRPDAEYKPIQSDLLYRYASNSQSAQTMPVGYVDLGSRRYLSTAPTTINPNLGYSNVQPLYTNNSYVPGLNSYVSGPSLQSLNFQQSQVFSHEQPTYINAVGEQNFSNVYAGNKYEYKYGNVPDFSSYHNV